MPDVQKAIQAILQAVQSVGGGFPATAPLRRVVCISRDEGTGGDEIARRLAVRLGVELYDQVILDKITRRLNAEPATLKAVEAATRPVRDLWLYSAFTGQDLSADHYRQHLINVVVSLARGDGVILGRGAHLILANAGALRVRLTGSEAVCAARIAAAEGLDPAAARQRVHDSNHRREQFVRETFGQGLGDANSFDLTLCTDHFADPDGIVDLLLRAFDQLTPPVVA